MQKINKEFEKIEKTIGNEFERVVHKPRKVLKRFPTVFLLLVTAVVVLVSHGFEQTFSQIGIFKKYPYLMIVSGIVILLFTGRLYKRLSK